jgi:hypothetical protein
MPLARSLALLAVTGGVSPALAQEPGGGDPDAREELARGAFLPFTDTPGSDVTRVTTHVIYSGATDEARVRSVGQLRINDRVQLEASVVYERGSGAPSLAIQYGALEEDTHGLDLQLVAGWDASGTNEVPAAYAEVAAGRTFAGSYLVTLARLDAGTSNERGLQLGLAGLRPLGALGGALAVGFDSRMRVDLNRDEIQMDEAGWALTAGPLVAYAFNRVAVIGALGFAANKPHTTQAQLGAFGSLGLGLVL